MRLVFWHLQCISYTVKLYTLHMFSTLGTGNLLSPRLKAGASQDGHTYDEVQYISVVLDGGCSGNIQCWSRALDQSHLIFATSLAAPQEGYMMHGSNKTVPQNHLYQVSAAQASKKRSWERHYNSGLVSAFIQWSPTWVR